MPRAPTRLLVRPKPIDLLERAVPLIRGRLQAPARHDSDLDSLRSHPRFQALLQRMNG
jgi:hypothetical protein